MTNLTSFSIKFFLGSFKRSPFFSFLEKKNHEKFGGKKFFFLKTHFLRKFFSPKDGFYKMIFSPSPLNKVSFLTRFLILPPLTLSRTISFSFLLWGKQ